MDTFHNNTRYDHQASYPFYFEKNFDSEGAIRWLNRNWHTGFWYASAYFVLVFGGQAWMKNRPRYVLRRPLILWNLSLAVFSILGSLRFVSEFLYATKHFGYVHTICEFSFYERNNVVALWTFLFALSKAAELGDTAFIVLRKQKLIFLHWYHHMVVLVYTWYAVQDRTGTGRWFIMMNYSVHGFMYSYYFLIALKVRLPKSIAMFVTSIQLLQMIVGCFVTIYAAALVKIGQPCNLTYETGVTGLLMYFSFFVLFAKLFGEKYLSREIGTKKVT